MDLSMVFVNPFRRGTGELQRAIRKLGTALAGVRGFDLFLVPATAATPGEQGNLTAASPTQRVQDAGRCVLKTQGSGTSSLQPNTLA